MIVYMTRKERRNLHRLAPGAPKLGSADTLRLLLGEVSASLNLATNQMGHDEECGEPANCATCVAWEDAAYMEDLVDDLLDDWQSPRQRFRTLRWQCLAAYRRWQRRAVPREPLSAEGSHAVVQAALALVNAGEMDKVKAALAMVGCVRVPELSDADVPAFMAALAP